MLDVVSSCVVYVVSLDFVVAVVAFAVVCCCGVVCFL